MFVTRNLKLIIYFCVANVVSQIRWVSRTQCLEALEVNGPAWLPRAEEVCSFTAAILNAAQSAAGQVTLAAQLPVRLPDGLVEAKQTVADNFQTWHPTYAILVKPDLDSSAGLSVLLVLVLLHRGRLVGLRPWWCVIWRGCQYLSPFLFLFFGSSDDEFRGQLLFLRWWTVIDTWHDFFRCKIRSKEIAHTLKTIQFELLNSKISIKIL